ncbi:polysaccharide biosynthesis protein [Nocardioides sp. YIM 123512]|uniref:Polysaccharide biosynthesis protein n=2 Tax=Nocardioides flavescens TaxID=2691959 RepID=A0A6L7EPK3_9ACTN|nr:polysaccharide biosynthesis protein [Nocardioides flavescens]MXG88530.1 polysaccharide biosynthesis protein [Nocardioides flavescens]
MTKMATETTQKLRSGAVVAVAMAVMNVSVYAYTVLVAHSIGKAPYGAFSALMGLLLVISVLSLGLQATGARRISAAPHQVAAIERVVLGVGLRSAVVLGGLCLLAAPLINGLLRLESLPTALLVGVTAFPLTYMGAQLGVLQGEERWVPLALVYLAQGLGRIGLGAALIVFRPTEFAAILGVAAGAWVPVVIAWFALRRPRARSEHSEGHPGLELLREVGVSSQALLAFFALSNLDIVLARATMPDDQAGLYAAGLILVKAVLFLPQFVVVLAFPAMSKRPDVRTMVPALAVIAVLGALGVAATALLPDLALLFVGGDDFAEVSGDLWKFGVVGTLLSMIQLLVYSALARRQGRAAVVLWTALAVLVVGALFVHTAPSLVLLVATIDAVLCAALLVIALISSREDAREPAGSATA